MNLLNYLSKNFDFSSALSASQFSVPHLALTMTPLFHPQAKDGRNSPDGSESHEADQENTDNEGSVSLVDQVRADH